MEVTIPCPCPPKADGTARHKSDTVTLRDKLDFRRVTALRNEVAYAKLDDPGMSSAEIMALLTEGYVLQGIESWSLRDAKGKDIPATKPAIRELLLESNAAEEIGDVADGLYGPVVLLPLVQRALQSSETTQTEDLTSPTTDGDSPIPMEKATSRSKRRTSQKRSKPSSTSPTQTAGTATITSLRVGGSNSSPSSASAA